jgi:hypothetical protein
VHIIIPKSRLRIFFPKVFNKAMSSRLVMGTVATAAAMPKEAKMKKTTGFVNPENTAEESGVIFKKGMRQNEKMQVIIMGSASVINRTRNATSKPMVRTPAWVSSPVPGINNTAVKITADTIMPTVPRKLFLLFICLTTTN